MLARLALTALAYLLVLGATAVVAFFGVLALGGPHGGLLPSFASPVVLFAGWAAVLVVPTLAARRVWRRTAKRVGQRSP